eukprot:3624093-Karenia_brevis.AAC.1
MDDREDYLTDLSSLVRSRPARSKVVVIGDWNVDMLTNDDREKMGLPSKSISSECALCQTWAVAHHLHFVRPFPSNVACGGVSSHHSQICPISWIPSGMQAGVPALLDFAFCSPNLMFRSSLSWDQAPGDHAFLVMDLQWDYQFKQRKSY